MGVRVCVRAYVQSTQAGKQLPAIVASPAGAAWRSAYTCMAI